MPKTAKIAISLPEDMLTEIERERRESSESRSEYIRRAVETLLRKRRERENSEKYIEAYRNYPETKEEVQESDRIGSEALAAEPWE